ncbi:hypothetical protein [Naumannella cuiyingiana]|uniref:Uncharacterized protein n=1 Tax=Naumannella cuiyingiana TaxID=1347891 RepID=A0A7Z0D7B1_9ACTN|nr:hypothetical protein [Naumannella cuiyingiana]NYI70223.1 hypothetical protein [Naumannella cuiyingiana]
MSSEPSGIVGPDGNLPPQPAAAQPGVPPAYPAPNVPDRGLGTGALIRLHLQPGPHNYRPAWTVDGVTQLSEWGTQLIPVSPGRHVVAAGYAVASNGPAQLPVQLAPGQAVDVYYRPGLWGTSRIGFAPHRGTGGLTCLIAVLVPLLVLAVLFFGLAMVAMIN